MNKITPRIRSHLSPGILFVFVLLQINAASATELELKLDKIRRDHDIAGLFLIIANRDTHREMTLGVTSHDTKQQLTPNHYIRLGSVSKLFLGLTALRLEQIGRLNLNEPLVNIVRDLPLQNPWHEDHPVTFAQLIEHSAGLTDMSKPEWAVKKFLSLNDAFAVDPNSRTLKWPAGMHSSYSNSGAGIAAYIIEQLSKETFEQVVKKEVFDPLGLSSATYSYDRDVEQSLITGYNTDGTTVIPYWHVLYRAFGGINIRAREMSRVLEIFLNDGRLDDQVIFTPGQIKRMSTPTTTVAARAGLTYGYGLGLYQYHHKGIPMIGHGGDADGYLTYLAFSPVLGKGYFVIINAFNSRAMKTIRNIIEDHLTEGKRALQPPLVHEMNQLEMSNIVGRYPEVTYRFRHRPPLEVFEEQGLLYTRQGTRKARLIPVSSTLYRRLGEPTATIVISQENDQTYFQSDGGNFRKH